MALAAEVMGLAILAVATAEAAKTLALPDSLGLLLVALEDTSSPDVEVARNLAEVD